MTLYWKYPGVRYDGNLALDHSEWGTVENLRRVWNHQINFKTFSQGHLQQLLQETLPVCDFTWAPPVVHNVFWRSALSAGHSQTSVLLLVILILGKLLRLRHPLQLQPVLAGVAKVRAGEALGCCVGEVLAEQIKKCLPGTKQLSREGLHRACSEDVVFRPVAQVEVEKTSLWGEGTVLTRLFPHCTQIKNWSVWVWTYK